MPDQGLEAYLQKLQAERAKLDVQIAGVLVELGREPSENGGLVTFPPPGMPPTGGVIREPVVMGRVRPDEFFRMSLGEAVKRYLEIMKQPQNPTAIVNALKAGGVLTQSKNFYTTVWTSLKRLRADGELVNTPTGWALSDWYPNKPRGGGDEKQSKRGKKRSKRAAAPKPRRAGSWQSFAAEQIKAGKTMKEAGEAWRKKKGEA